MERRILFMTEKERFQALVDDLENMIFYQRTGEFTDLAVSLRIEQNSLGVFPQH